MPLTALAAAVMGLTSRVRAPTPCRPSKLRLLVLIEYWPAAFPRGSDPIEIEYLLEEMEGFGIARHTYSGGFALRSRSLLELMAYDEADLTSKLKQ